MGQGLSASDMVLPKCSRRAGRQLCFCSLLDGELKGILISNVQILIIPALTNTLSLPLREDAPSSLAQPSHAQNLA